MTRKDLTLKDKIDLLDKLKSISKSTTIRQKEMFTGVPKSTLSRLLKEEDSLRIQWDNFKRNNASGLFSRTRDGKDPDVEVALNEWFSIVRTRGVRVTGPMLKTKAEELAKRFGHLDFKATEGWLSRWKGRFNIKYKKAYGEKESGDLSSAEGWKLNVLPQLLNDFSPNDIYNADETGLYYRATPDGSLTYKNFVLSGSKKSLDRLTVLC
jgi:hypothetical protein